MKMGKISLWIMSMVVLLGASVYGDNFRVENNLDSGAGSLRQALADADASPGYDSILFDDVGTITIASSLVINGNYLFLGNTSSSIQVTIDAHTTGFDALVVYGSNVVIRNLAFIRTSSPLVSGTAIDIRGDYVHVVGCRVGTDWHDSSNSNFYTGINVQGTVSDPAQYVRIGYRLGQADERCIIGRNVAGIRSAYTTNLMIANNYIGLNSSGTSELNSSYGIIMDHGTVQALVGSFLTALERNIICGINTGIRISGTGASSYGNSINAVWMNAYADGSPSSLNFQNDILLQSGAVGNFIGRPAAAGAAPNLIYDAYIAVSGTAQHNAILGNTLVAEGTSEVIDLVLSGSNDGQAAPIITTVNPGIIAGTGADGDIIEVFLSDRGAGNRGGALHYLGTTTVTGSTWSLIPAGLVGGEFITAIATDSYNNSSEFALNVMVQHPTPTMTPSFTPTVTATVTPTLSATTSVTVTPSPTSSTTPTSTPTATISATSTVSATITVTSTISTTSTISPTGTVSPTVTRTKTTIMDGEVVLPVPNPARDEMRFILSLEEAAKVKLDIYNLSGERIGQLQNNFGPGEAWMNWNCREVAPGIYLLRVLINGEEAGVRKIAVVH